VGAYYFRSHNHTGGRLDINFSGLDFLSDDTAITTSKSGFAHVRWHATDKLGVNMGARYTRDTKDYTFNRLNPDGTLPPCGFPGCTPNSNWQLAGMSNVTGPYEGSNSDYRLGVDYQWTPDLMTYAQVSTGYKGGGTNPRPFFPTQIRSFDPEILTSYELGLKSDWLDNKARTNLAVFYSKYKDIQQNISRCDNYSPFPGAPCLMPVNAGDADIKGVELEAQLQLTRALAMDASLSYLDFEYTRINPATGITLDMISTYTPERKASLGIEYGFELGSGGTLTPRADWNYQSEIYTNTAVNTAGNRVAGYGVTNLRLMWADAEAQWEGSLALTNVFDKFYYANKIDLQRTNGYINGRPGRPREWLVSVTRRF
jgi:iron complex outermembrane receptor protein